MESWTEKIVKFYDRDCTVECRRYVMFRLFGTGSGRVEKEGALALWLGLGSALWGGDCDVTVGCAPRRQLN